MDSVAPKPIARVLVVGDTYGAPELLAKLPVECVVGLIAAEIRPNHYDEMKRIASKANLPLIIQPRVDSSGYAAFCTGLSKLRPDGLICHSYSMLIRDPVLQLVEGRAFNVHMALLPHNRGPNPVQWALIRGEHTTGVSLHVMNQHFDGGDIIDQVRVRIADTDTWLTLTAKLKESAKKLLDRAIPFLLKGTWRAVPQQEEKASWNKRISGTSFAVDFSNMTDMQIYNLIRAQVAPLRGAYLDTPAGRLRFTKRLSLNEISELRRSYQ